MLRTTILFFLYTAVCHSQNTRYYVDWQSSGLNNGQSWSDAYRTLHDALSASDSGDEIWVARGTYFPATQLLIVTSAIPVRLDNSLCVVFAHSINCFKVGMDSSGDFILTDIP
jgi:hypothetical protein